MYIPAIPAGNYSNLAYDRETDRWNYLASVPGWALFGKYLFYNEESRKWELLFDMTQPPNQKKDILLLRMGGWDGTKVEYREVSRERLRNTGFERQGNGVAIVAAKDGGIWWLGGMGKWTGTGESVVIPYDPIKDKWPEVVVTPREGTHLMNVKYSDLPRMLERRMEHRAVVASDGKIYVMGGFRREPEFPRDGKTVEIVSDTMECFDPQTGRWEYKKPLSSKRMGFAAVMGADDKIYLFGGSAGMTTRKETPILDVTEVYDPKADAWSNRKPMPEPRSGHACAQASNGKIYVMGGVKSEETGPLADVFIYDPLKDEWERGPKMNTRRGDLAAVATPDGRIYAIGGTDKGAYKDREQINAFLPSGKELYEGKVQETVEALDISK